VEYRTLRRRASLAVRGWDLVISRRLAELMGGEVGVRKREGQGSDLTGSRQSLTNSLRAKLLEGLPQADLRSVRILAVDDNATNSPGPGRATGFVGVRHAEAESAARAIDMLRAARAEG